MADEGEIDIEGDFDFKLEAYSDMYDANELPSKSVNLLPEYTNPPWLLEQGWTLDSCMDEKSKATIEKMLLEEQHYLNGKPSTRSNSGIKSTSTASQQEKVKQGRRQWTQDEKAMFETGIEVHGRKWRLIADMIPTKTTLQVKNYAHQCFKNQNKDIELSAVLFADITPASNSNPLDCVLDSVSTAKPTVKPVSNSSKKSPGRQNCKQKPTKKIDRTRDLSSQHLQPAGHSCLKTFIHDPKSDISASNCEISHSNSVNLNSSINTCTNVEVSASSQMLDLSDDDDIEVDVDGDIDIDDEDDNSLLKSRSASPNSVYEKLLQAANVTTSCSRKAVYEKTSIISCPQKPTEKVDIFETKKSEEYVQTQSFKDEDYIMDMKIIPCEESEKQCQQTSTVAADDMLYQSTNLSSDVSEKKIVNAVVLFDGRTVEFPIPEAERCLQKDIITDEEKKIHLEFFDGRPSKTPERYLKIRNYLTNSWEFYKPTYLNKTSVRPGLKNCGDVNCIGRIHAYLECTGVINFGCEQASYNHPVKSGVPTPRDRIVKEVNPGAQLAKLEAMRPRKRRIRDAFGIWVYENDIEGKTIEHKNICEDVKLRVPRQSKTIVYDPFKLIPCASFSEERPAPFLVQVLNTVLITMDVHAHISKTEVIGLLGGLYCEDQRKLTINLAVPCESISTGMQCEMEPVSQTQASEQICEVGLQVVGWYHSHPTFAPNPSVRDIETQLKFQNWFSKGGSQFVGMIVSPYCRTNPGLMSQFNCLTISEDVNTINKSNVPYSFAYEIESSEIEQQLLCTVLGELADKYSTHQNRVELTLMYRASTGISCLNKMIESVRSSCLHSPETGEILQFIVQKFSDAFTLKYDSSMKNQDTDDIVEVKLNSSVVDHGS